MLKFIFRGVAALILCTQLGACAAVMSGTSQAVFVETPMADGASCRLTDSKKGTWFLQSTPGSVTVQKGDGPMNVVCDKTGYNSGILAVDEELDGVTMGNILIGGVVGFVADAASGAAQKYPDKVTVWLRPKEWVSPDAEIAWNRLKAEQEEAARLEKERKAGRRPEPKPAPPATQITYQPMYLNSNGTLTPAPAPQPGQPNVVYMMPSQPAGQGSVAIPQPVNNVGVVNPTPTSAADTALQAYKKTGQQEFQDKINATATAKTGQSSAGVASTSVASADEDKPHMAGQPAEQTPPTVYMMPIVVQTPPSPPPPPRSCEPGNKAHLLGSGCR